MNEGNDGVVPSAVTATNDNNCEGEIDVDDVIDSRVSATAAQATIAPPPFTAKLPAATTTVTTTTIITAAEPPTPRRSNAKPPASQPARAAATARSNNNNNNGQNNDQVFSNKTRLVKRHMPRRPTSNRVKLANQHWTEQVWHTLSRFVTCRRTGVQVVFSNRAIVSYREDVQTPCFQIRLFDMGRRHPVVQATCSLYVISQKSPVPMPLRVLIPSEKRGSLLFLSLPNEVVHAIDDSTSSLPVPNAETASMVKPQGRYFNSAEEEQDDVVCPVCGEPYDTVHNLILHGKYQDIVEAHEQFPVEGSHQEVDWDEWEKTLTRSRFWSLAQLKDYFESSISEVICVVEGIDPISGGTFHAVQSYVPAA